MLGGWPPAVPSFGHVLPLATHSPSHWRYFRAASFSMCGVALLAAIALKLVWRLFTLAQAVSLWMADGLMLV